MLSAGIDIGSRTIKLAVVEDGAIVHTRIESNSYDPLNVCGGMLSGIKYDTITATGYGRHLFNSHYDSNTISEIKAFAIGAGFAISGSRTILDIGGQDTKVISINPGGRVNRFEMNDKCAAGTGKFLEIMATALGFSMDEFIEAGMSAEKSVNINSMCTVFAESEVISMIARGADRAEVARGIHQTIVKRSAAMLKRIQIEDNLAFLGGVALNPCVKALLEQEIGRDVHVPENPQIIGALGCALNNGGN